MSFCVEADMLKRGFPAYTTSVGWLGYSDDKITKVRVFGCNSLHLTQPDRLELYLSIASLPVSQL